jgi:endonuclease/exonuclease/phosphatase family metal-dependent hydrolase
VRDKVEYYIENGKAVVLMGDFNVEPPEPPLDVIYHSQIFADEFGFGRFKEVDQDDTRWMYQGSPPCRCGEPTSGEVRKLDYIFLSGGHWKVVDGDATHSDYSDHQPLRGWADTM